jgi:hypothetical protein
MRFGELRSIGHNIADSLADGYGPLFGSYDSDVYDLARQSAAGFIEVDFLTGSWCGGPPSAAAARAFELCREVLPSLCEKHGVPHDAFLTCKARFFCYGHVEQFIVTVEDRHGRRAIDEYTGRPGKRVKLLDPLGRVRKRPTTLIRVNV